MGKFLDKLKTEAYVTKIEDNMCQPIRGLWSLADMEYATDARTLSV